MKVARCFILLPCLLLYEYFTLSFNSLNIFFSLFVVDIPLYSYSFYCVPWHYLLYFVFSLLCLLFLLFVLFLRQQLFSNHMIKIGRNNILLQVLFTNNRLFSRKSPSPVVCALQPIIFTSETWFSYQEVTDSELRNTFKKNWPFSVYIVQPSNTLLSRASLTFILSAGMWLSRYYSRWIPFEPTVFVLSSIALVMLMNVTNNMIKRLKGSKEQSHICSVS